MLQLHILLSRSKRASNNMSLIVTQPLNSAYFDRYATVKGNNDNYYIHIKIKEMHWPQYFIFMHSLYYIFQAVCKVFC